MQEFSRWPHCISPICCILFVFFSPICTRCAAAAEARTHFEGTLWQSSYGHSWWGWEGRQQSDNWLIKGFLRSLKLSDDQPPPGDMNTERLPVGDPVSTIIPAWLMPSTFIATPTIFKNICNLALGWSLEPQLRDTPALPLRWCNTCLRPATDPENPKHYSTHAGACI